MTQSTSPAMNPTPKKKSNVKINLLILVISIIIGLLIGEIIVRIYVRGNLKTIYQKKARQKAPNGGKFDLKDILVSSNNPRLVYELIPYRHGTFEGIRYRSNANGMRGPKISKKKPKGVWRIAALGDSTMFGWGIREEETFPAVLQRALNSGSDSRKYEVLNFSVPGYNTAMEVELFRSRAEDFDPDLVMIHFDLNDLGLPNFIQELPPFFTLKRFYILDLIKSFFVERDAQKSLEEMSDGGLHDAPRIDGPRLNGMENFIQYQARFVPEEYHYMVGWDGVHRALDHLWDSTPLPILHISWVYSFDVGYSEYAGTRDLFAQYVNQGRKKRKDGERLYFLNIMSEGYEFCREMGLKWIEDLTVNYPDDVHPSAARHILIARAVYLFLVKNRLLSADSNHYRQSEVIAQSLWDQAKRKVRRK
jgi:lysophospholipase L1-like esterase